MLTTHLCLLAVKASTDTTIALIPKVFEPPTKLWKFPKEKDVFWYPEQTTVPPSNYTPGMSFIKVCHSMTQDIDETGLIPLIKKGLLKGQSSQLIRRAVLCNQNTVHIHREAWDAAWGCGSVRRAFGFYSSSSHISHFC